MNSPDTQEVVPEQFASTPVGDLTYDELLETVERLGGGGINIGFAGKTSTRRLARRVRPRTMRRIKKYGIGTEEQRAENRLIEGDNLQAMTTLYKERGKIDLIITDPPYNTGNDFRYNDKWDQDPNDPGLGEWVTSEDGARRTKWMKFMWPRLAMMKSMLKPGGVLAICIDYRELFRLGQMLDELFGEANRLAIINWQKSTALKNDNGHVSSSTEYVLVYAKDEDRAVTGRLPREGKQNSRYSNPDGDRGLWREGQLKVRTWAEKDDYGIQSPFTGEIHYPTGRTAWRHPKQDIRRWLAGWGSEYVEEQLDDGRVPALVVRGGFSADTAKVAGEVLEAGPWPFIWFGLKGTGGPRKKIFLEDVRRGIIPDTFWAKEDMYESEGELGSASWSYQESGRANDGAAELTAIVGDGHAFDTVKPLKLISKIIQIWCPPDGTVMDPFAGSGTTGHAVFALNNDGGDRRFILIEQGRPDRGDPYAVALTAKRLRNIISGRWATGANEPLAAGFEFLRLGRRVDAAALLRMEREEMIDTVIESHFDATRRRGSQLTREPVGCRYLVARNSENEGFFLVWDGPDKNIDITEAVYEEIVDEAENSGLSHTRYHVYARLWRYQTDDVRFLQIPDRILADFGLDPRSEPFTDPDS